MYIYCIWRVYLLYLRGKSYIAPYHRQSTIRLNSYLYNYLNVLSEPISIFSSLAISSQWRDYGNYWRYIKFEINSFKNHRCFLKNFYSTFGFYYCSICRNKFKYIFSFVWISCLYSNGFHCSLSFWIKIRGTKFSQKNRKYFINNNFCWIYYLLYIIEYCKLVIYTFFELNIFK